MNENYITLILADGEPLCILGIRATLAHHANLVILAEVSECQEMFDLCRRHQPHLLIIDPKISNSSPNILFKLIRQCSPQTKILLLTANDAYMELVADMGIAGYMLKSEASSQLKEAIEHVAQGKGWFSHGLAYRFFKKEAENQAIASLLTQRELEILQQISQGQDVADTAETLSIAPRTVSFHLTNIYQKINVNCRAQAVAWAWQHNLVKKRG